MLFMMWHHSCGKCIMNDFVNSWYPHQFLFLEHVSLDRGVTTALIYSFIALIFFIVENAARILKNASTEPSGSSTQVLRMHRQHAADYMKLMMESGINLTIGEDRAALLITEVCCSMPTS